MTSRWDKMPELDDKEIRDYSTWLKQEQVYREVVNELEDFGCTFVTIFSMAKAYWTWEPKALDEKLQQMSGFSNKVIKKRAEQLRDLAADIERLNNTPLPGSTNFLDLVREYGDSDGELGEENPAQRFEELPQLLKRYATSLNGWPHPEYRKMFSDRNSARAYRVAQLCLYVSAFAGSPMYDAVDKLLESVRLFLHHKSKLRLRKEDNKRDVKSQFIGFKERNPTEYRRLEQKTEYIARR
jgi:hypothetical protein